MSCVTSEGYKAGENIRHQTIFAIATAKQAAAVALAMDNAQELISSFKKQRDIQSDSLGLAEELQRRLQNKFWPKELQFLAEFAVPEQIEEAERYGRRFAGRLVAGVAGKFRKIEHQLKCNTPRYCTSSFAQTMQKLQASKAEAVANARVLGRELGFAYRMSREDIDYDRRLKAIGLGKNLIGQCKSLYESAGSHFATAGASAAEGLGNALELFGAADKTTTMMFDGFFKERESEFAKYGKMPDPYSMTNVVQNAVKQEINNFTETIGSAFEGVSNALSASSPTSNVTENIFANTASLTNLSVNTGISPNVDGEGYLGTSVGYNVTNDVALERGNEASIGKRSLARIGTQTFKTSDPLSVLMDSDGKLLNHQHSVAVNINKYEYGYTDHLNSNQGDAPPTSSA